MKENSDKNEKNEETMKQYKDRDHVFEVTEIAVWTLAS